MIMAGLIDMTNTTAYNNTRSGYLPGIVISILSLGMALLFGLLASTANPILIGAGAGLLVGLLLMFNLSWNIWLILVLGMLVVGVMPIWLDFYASKAVWGVSILGLMLLLSVLGRLLVDRRATSNLPAFVWVALLFMIYTLVVSAFRSETLYEYLSGFKRYYQVFALIFALAIFNISERQIAQWRKFFLLVALVQLPWAIYELISLVPLRESIRYAYPGMVPIDVVAGTFGSSLYVGGANAEMAGFLIIVLLFLLARFREGILPMRHLVLLSIIVLPPLFLGETKAVVVMLPLVFLTLYRRELLFRPHVALIGLLLGGLLTIAAGYAYLNYTKRSLDNQIAETLSYNVYEKGYGSYKLNRTTVLGFWAEQQGMHDPLSAVIGNGLGSAHDTTGGHIAQLYPRFGISLTAASSLLWETGVIGTGLFLSMLALAWQAASKVRRMTKDALMRADAAAIQAALPLFAFFLIYRATMIETLSFQILFACMLGYLAWLYRHVSEHVRC
jgi:hypothetical protein